MSASQEPSTNNEPGTAAPVPIKANGAISARDFLLAVAPFPADNEEGFVNIHRLNPEKKGLPGKSCRTVEQALKEVARLQGKGCHIYFCVSRQRLGKGNRSRANTTGMWSLFVAADIDPNNPQCFPDLPEAISSILAFCHHLGIPKPSLVVFTGGGLHVYWLSDKMLTVEDWQPYADGLKAAMLEMPG